MQALKFSILAKDDFSHVFNTLISGHLPSLKMVALATAGAITALGGTLFAMAKTTANAYEEIGKLAKQTGTSTQFLSSMRYSAKMTDIEVGNMERGFKKLTIGIGDAIRDGGPLKDVFDELGISLKTSAGSAKNVEEVLPELAEKFASLRTETDKMALSSKLFGERNYDMVRLLADGPDALKKYADEARAFGLVIDKQAAANADKFNDSLDHVKFALTGVKNAIGEQVMPKITALAERFSNFVKNNRAEVIDWGNKLIESFGSIAAEGARSVGFIIDAWHNLKVTWAGLKVSGIEFSDWLHGQGEFFDKKNQEENELKLKRIEELKEKIKKIKTQEAEDINFIEKWQLKSYEEDLATEESILQESLDKRSIQQQRYVDAVNAYNKLLADPPNAEKYVTKLIENTKNLYSTLDEEGTAQEEKDKEKTEEFGVFTTEHLFKNAENYSGYLENKLAIDEAYYNALGIKGK